MARRSRGCPRVLLLGGPGANVEGVGAALAQTYGAKHVSAIDLLHGAALNGSKEGMKAMKAPDPLGAASDAFLFRLVRNRLACEDVRTSGFVLTGFPSSTRHAALLKKHDVWLRDVVHLELAADAAMNAVTKRRYDPVDGAIYHLETNPPEDDATRSRLVIHPKDEPEAFKRDMKAWAATAKDLMKVFAAELRAEDASRPERELVERLAPCFLGKL